ncbi:class I adenylate-forming enzyme family protein [Streptomyces yaizuensis]|uniref:Acyl--CoA ligase n=1 Tax=Streptomyces yaizuensis TaxID=2989713 RepID=A0ABQ5NRH1_9ACTN|nr:class I adenylate-forming enzyme family protein [Streptomyces sp. YSPA8]GLF92646.1 acyl--CoA ligase [Streptomyces sp. YSPA8]
MFLQRVGNKGIRLGTVFDRAAARHPASPVYLDHHLDIAPGLGRRLTLTEIADLIDDHATRLWAARVRPGERVVIHKSDNFDISLLAYSVARAGAIPVLLSPQLDGVTVARLLERLRRPTLLTDAAKLEKELPPEVFDLTERVLTATGDFPGATPLTGLSGIERIAPVPRPQDQPALITHTSGTTGLPKLAVQTGITIQARCRPQSVLLAPVGRHEPIAVHVSFAHSRMISGAALFALRGHPLIILRDDDPEQVAELFARVPPGVIESHPNTLLHWEVLADHPAKPLANVRCFSNTFDAIHPRTVGTLLGASERRLPFFAQTYGQSETGAIAARTYTRHRRAGADGRCVGRTFPGMTEVRIVSRDGRTPTKDSPGHIEVRSGGRIVDYFGEHERYDRQFSRDGWWRMGDLGYRTRWGCLHLLDREVDEIPGISSTLELEDKLFTRLPELLEVIIVPGGDGAPVPVVCTRDDRPLDRGRWESAVEGLPGLAAPVQRRLDELPHTATTKVKRLELARELSQP